MIAICERTSIETAVENATNFSVYAVIRLFSIIDIIKRKKIIYSVTRAGRHFRYKIFLQHEHYTMFSIKKNTANKRHCSPLYVITQPAIL